VKLITGSSNLSLANKISTFADGEKYVRILESVRGENIYIIQSVSPPINDHFVGYPIYTIVAPDVGAVKLAQNVADFIVVPIAIINKRRVAHNQIEILNFIGEIKGKIAVLVDDMIDTGGTITSAANLLIENGAKEVYICATHALFSKDAIDKLTLCKAKQVIVLDTVAISKDKINNKIKILSTSKLLAEAIRRIDKDGVNITQI